MRIAFYAPRASHLTPGESGDKVYVRTLLAGLRGRGHDVKLVSDLNVRKFWRRRVHPWRLITEALTIRKEMKRFSPDVWLVFGASVKNPDLFGWWQRTGRYVLMNSYVGKGTGLPRLWRWLFVLAHRRSLRKADRIAAWRQKRRRSPPFLRRRARACLRLAPGGEDLGIDALQGGRATAPRPPTGRGGYSLRQPSPRASV